MQVNSVASTNSTNTVSSEAGKSVVSKDGFLKILTAELQYQDPTNAQDSSQYVAEMAQFSTLEQMQNLNESIEKLLLSQKFVEASSMIGKTAKIWTGDDSYITGVVSSARLGSSGTINIVVDGKEYDMDNVVELAGGESGQSAV